MTNSRNEYGERRIPRNTAPGRYLLREASWCADPFEAEILEWSAFGRVKLRYLSGAMVWIEPDERPFLVERLQDSQPQPEDSK